MDIQKELEKLKEEAKHIDKHDSAAISELKSKYLSLMLTKEFIASCRG